jgi:quercetin dioxygenase-like cupin family protein
MKQNDVFSQQSDSGITLDMDAAFRDDREPDAPKEPTVMKPESFIVTPTTRADALNVIGMDITVLATNVQTQGYEITLQKGAEGMGPPPHHHPWDESFYVIKGSIDMTVAGKTTRCEPGTLVHIPAGTAHSFRFGPQGGEMFEITGAGGAATRMFTDVAKRIPPGPPDLGLAARVLSDNGVSLVAP